MLSAVGELKRLLSEFNAKSDVQISAIVSKSGVPIAWSMPEGIKVENFATLAATMVGSAEVLYSGLNRPAPTRVVAEAEGHTLMARALGTKALLIVLATADATHITKQMEELTKQLVDVLKAQG